MALEGGAPESVSILEVSPRDGLQNEHVVVPTAGKKRLIEALRAAGLARIEVTSFVSPKWVPQLADALDLCAALRGEDGAYPVGARYSALCPNATGLERALAAGLPEIAVFMSASETHNRKNINKTIDATLEVFREIVPPARQAGLRVRAYVSTVWGCPYEGPVDVGVVARIASALVELGCYEVSLGDTIGVGTPNQTREVVTRLGREIGLERIALHFHDTRGTALANALVGLQLGVSKLDASVGGVGGCPYAPGAAGNLATEDLVYMLDGMGIATGINLRALVKATLRIEQVLGRPVPSKVVAAMRADVMAEMQAEVSA